MNRNILFGAIGLLVLAISAVVVAGAGGSGNHYWVTNLDNPNTSYWVKIAAAQNTTACDDSDNGMKPDTQGTLIVDTLNPVTHRTLTESANTTGIVREFMCGDEVNIAGLTNNPGWAYLVFYNSNDPNNNPGK